MRCKALFRQQSSLVLSGREKVAESLSGNSPIRGERGTGTGGHRFWEVKGTGRGAEI